MIETRRLKHFLLAFRAQKIGEQNGLVDNVNEHSRWLFYAVRCVFLILNISCHGYLFLGLSDRVYKKTTNGRFSMQVVYGCQALYSVLVILRILLGYCWLLYISDPHDPGYLVVILVI